MHSDYISITPPKRRLIACALASMLCVIKLQLSVDTNYHIISIKTISKRRNILCTICNKIIDV